MSSSREEQIEKTDFRQSPPNKSSDQPSCTTVVPKTPVSILQEIYIAEGITPKYDLVQIEGKVHEPTFKFRVTVGEIVALGSGNSKKIAKHEAARNILRKIKAAQDYFHTDGYSITQDNKELQEISRDGKVVSMPTPSTVVNVKLPNLETILNSSYDEDKEVSGDPIGELQELCVTRKIRSPVYNIKSNEGLPHERYFVIDCVLGSKYRETAKGRSKKVAKKKVAAKMLETLKTQPFDIDSTLIDNNNIFIDTKNTLSITDDDIVDNLAKLNKSLRLENQASQTRSTSVLSELQPLIINNKAGSKLRSLQSPNSDFLSSGNNFETAIKYLQDIATEQDFNVTYIDVEERSKTGKYHCFVQLTTNPVTVCFGVGENSSKEAHVDAARNTLEYLRIMTS